MDVHIGGPIDSHPDSHRACHRPEVQEMFPGRLLHRTRSEAVVAMEGRVIDQLTVSCRYCPWSSLGNRPWLGVRRLNGLGARLESMVWLDSGDRNPGGGVGVLHS